MRLIGNLEDQQQAERFVAYLITEGIQAQSDAEDGHFEIWIKDEDLIPQAVQELDAFRTAPNDDKYAAAIATAQHLRIEEEKRRRQYAKNVVNVSSTVGKKNRPLTIFLIVICGVVALLTEFGEYEARSKATFRALAFNGASGDVALRADQDSMGNIDSWSLRLASIRNGELWRLVTPIFIHFGGFHLVFNMYWLFILGSQIEHRYGTFWYALLIVSSAVISNFFQCVVPMQYGGLPPYPIGEYLITSLGGMSGVNYALLGFIWMRITYDRSSGMFLPQSTIIILLVWLVFCMSPLAEQFGFGNVANWAHVMGLLVGIVAGYWPTLIPKRPGRSK